MNSRETVLSSVRSLAFAIVSAVALGAHVPMAIAGDCDTTPSPTIAVRLSPFEGEVLVVCNADVNRNGLLDADESLVNVEDAIRGEVLQRAPVGRNRTVLRVRLRSGWTWRDAVADGWALHDPRIIAVEENQLVRALVTPNDPLFTQLWGLHNTGAVGGFPDADIDAPEAWAVTTGSSDEIVAVVDSGIDYLHPDLADNMWRNPGESGSGRENNDLDDDGNGYVDDVFGFDFVNDDPDPTDSAGHGTHVAGTIAARGNNGLGVAGVNWRCRLMACRFLDASGSGSTFDAIEAINYAVANGAQILNNSWGGGGYSTALLAAIENARDHGVLFVAAAGNSALDNDVFAHYPSSYAVENVVAVAATDNTDALAYFSNFGSASVHLGAPGESVLSCIPSFSVLFQENFQTAVTPPAFPPGWTLEGPANRWGVIYSEDIAPNNRAARGDWAHASPYSADSDGSLVTPAVDTRGLRGLYLQFSFRWAIDPSDRCTVDVWDGAAWRELLVLQGGYIGLPFYFYTVLDIPDRYRSDQTRVRFRWITDGDNNNYDGIEIDDIFLVGVGASANGQYELYSGTSMAAPHVAGVAALLLGLRPDMTLTELRNRLVYTGDSIPALAGITVSQRRLNALNALTAPDGLQIESPDGGEVWDTGSQRTIRWQPIESSPTVDITLLKGGSPTIQIATAAPNNGAFAWQIPDALPAGSDYRIRVASAAYTDQSAGNFAIVPVTKLYHEDFESGMGGWTLDNSYYSANGLWHLSTGRGSDAGHTPAHSLYYGTGEGPGGGGNYGEGRSAGLAVSPRINLQQVTPPITLEFSYVLETPGFAPDSDLAVVEASRDGGPFTPLAANGGLPVRLTDPTFNWQRLSVDLSAYAGSVTQVRFRFEAGQFFGLYYEGFYVDDVRLVGALTPGCPLAPEPVAPFPPDGEPDAAVDSQLTWGPMPAAAASREYVAFSDAEAGLPAQLEHTDTLTQRDAPRASSRGAATVRILNFVGHADPAPTGEPANLIAAIASRFTDFSVTNTTSEDPDALAGELGGLHILLIPSQENWTESDMAQFGSNTAAVLTSFVSSGGLVIVADPIRGDDFAAAAGLLMVGANSTPSGSNRQCTPQQPFHPIMTGVASPFAARAVNASFNLPTDGVVLATLNADGRPIAISRDLCGGGVLLLGWDFASSSTAMSQIIGNAILWTAGGGGSPSFDVYLGTDNPPTQLACTNLSAPHCDPGPLNPGGHYYWQVVARSCCGETPGPVWSFGTQADCNSNGTPDSAEIASGQAADCNHSGVPDACELPGDLNCDAVLNIADISAFMLAFADPAGYAAAYPDCRVELADLDCDGVIDCRDWTALRAIVRPPRNMLLPGCDVAVRPDPLQAR